MVIACGVPSLKPSKDPLHWVLPGMKLLTPASAKSVVSSMSTVYSKLHVLIPVTAAGLSTCPAVPDLCAIIAPPNFYPLRIAISNGICYTISMDWTNKEQVRNYHRAYRAKKLVPRLIEANKKRDLLYKSLWNLPPIELAYIAGLVDGEGCITIVTGHHKRLHPNWSPEYALHISVANQFVPALEYLKSATGLGSVHHDKGKNFTWLIGSQRAKEFLLSIRPHLKIKAKQADIAIKFQSLFSVWAPLPLTDNQRQERAELKREIMRLNHS